MGNVDTVVLCSGGIDSITLVGLLLSKGFSVHLLHVNYGQVTVDAERRSIEYCAEAMQIDAKSFLNVDEIGNWGLGSLVSGSSESSYFPHRNLFLLSCASIVAAWLHADSVAIGSIDCANSEFRDGSSSFINQISALLQENDKLPKSILSPLESLNKSQVVELAIVLGIPLNLCFSCNRFSHRHCSECSSCLARNEAFRAHGVSL